MKLSSLKFKYSLMFQKGTYKTLKSNKKSALNKCNFVAVNHREIPCDYFTAM